MGLWCYAAVADELFQQSFRNTVTFNNIKTLCPVHNCMTTWNKCTGFKVDNQKQNLNQDSLKVKISNGSGESFCWQVNIVTASCVPVVFFGEKKRAGTAAHCLPSACVLTAWQQSSTICSHAIIHLSDRGLWLCWTTGFCRVVSLCIPAFHYLVHWPDPSGAKLHWE